MRDLSASHATPPFLENVLTLFGSVFRGVIVPHSAGALGAASRLWRYLGCMLAAAGMSAGGGAAHANESVSVATESAAAHPLWGSWAGSVPNTSCKETVRYQPDGTRQASSGTSQSQGTYSIASKPSLLGFYQLQDTLTQSKGQADCWGDAAPEVGQSSVVYVQFSPTHTQFIVCKEESLKACFGPFARQTP